MASKASKVQSGDQRQGSASQKRRGDRRRPWTSPAAKEFLELAHESLDQVEQAANDADPSLDAELNGLIEEIAALAARVRVRLARCEAQPAAPSQIARISSAKEEANEELNEEPSEGAALVARQLARAGAVAPEIEEVLDELGVSEPRKVVRRTLD
jgi:hypothetical protein